MIRVTGCTISLLCDHVCTGSTSIDAAWFSHCTEEVPDDPAHGDFDHEEHMPPTDGHDFLKKKRARLAKERRQENRERIKPWEKEKAFR